MGVSVSFSSMSLFLIALFLQQPLVSEKFFNDGERIPLRSSELFLRFQFGRADLIEIVPVGRQDDPSVRITSAAIRNLMLLNSDRSYVVQHAASRHADTWSFTSPDPRQDGVVIVSVPECLRLHVSYNGNDVPVAGPLKESLFLHDLAIKRGKPGAVISLLNERLKNHEIVLMAAPPSNSKARVIHRERP